MLSSGGYWLMSSGLGWKPAQDPHFIHPGAPLPSWESILLHPCTDPPDHKSFSSAVAKNMLLICSFFKWKSLLQNAGITTEVCIYRWGFWLSLWKVDASLWVSGCRTSPWPLAGPGHWKMLLKRAGGVRLLRIRADRAGSCGRQSQGHMAPGVMRKRLTGLLWDSAGPRARLPRCAEGGAGRDFACQVWKWSYLYAFMCPGKQENKQTVLPAAGRGKKAISK